MDKAYVDAVVYCYDRCFARIRELGGDRSSVVVDGRYNVILDCYMTWYSGMTDAECDLFHRIRLPASVHRRKPRKNLGDRP